MAKKKDRIYRATLSTGTGTTITTKRSISPISTTRSECIFDADNRGTEDCESEPDRSNPAWKVKESAEEVVIEGFEGEVEPEIVLKPPPNIWEEILKEFDSERAEFDKSRQKQQTYPKEKIPFGSILIGSSSEKDQKNEKKYEPVLKPTAVDYLEEFVFPILCPALEETLKQARKVDCLKIQKCIFSGLDYIAELLWNRNPLHPKRRNLGYKSIFEIPFVTIWLHKNPRPIYPLSWVWTKEQAVVVMQTYIRRYFVCRDPDCCEMRKFWQIFRQEKVEEKLIKKREYEAEVKEIVENIIDGIIANSVYKVEYRRHGCFCIAKPCHCVCKCSQWCKCCKCYKEEKGISKRFYSPSSTTVSDSSW